MHRLLVAAVLGALCCAPAAAAEEYAPLDRAGPALKEKASLVCSPGVDNATVTPVLLNPATGVTAEQNWSWNYEPALTKLGIPWCAYTAPQQTLGDIQRSGELLVDAIRTLHGRAGRRISIIGHSQGGMSMRWALRFWPDTRAMVDDVIGFAPSNHGTTMVGCDNGCLPAVWQQLDGSRFITALNSRAETFEGISYTNVYTRLDEVVQPNSSSELHTGAGRITNVATQDLCPANVYEHLTVGTVDPVAYALAIDALTHDGPAVPSRIPGSTCLQVFHPGVEATQAQTLVQILSALPGLGSVPVSGVEIVDGVDLIRAEPELRCYTLLAGCGDAAVPASCTSKRRFTIRLPRGIRGARVTLNGKRLKVRRSKGRAVSTIDLRGRSGSKRVVVRVSGKSKAGRKISQTRRYKPCTAGKRA